MTNLTLLRRLAAPQPRLLDLLPGAVAAYGLRLLRAGYLGPAVRVRRSSDNAEQDFYFDHLGRLNIAALLNFCGAGSGFVTKFYDQTGGGYHALQTTSSAQPTIVSFGVLVPRRPGCPR